MNNNTQPYLIPLSIVIAGALVAGGIYFGGITGKGQQTAVGGREKAVPEITLAAVSANEHVLGNPNAKIAMVEFSDTECPFCKQFQTTLHSIVNEYGKDGTLAWVYRHFPIDSLHPKSRKEAEATECAAEQGGNDAFWKYLDEVYKRTTSNNKLDPAELPKIAASQSLDMTAFNECLVSGKFAAKVDENYKDAVKAGGTGTPYTVFILKDKVSDEVTSFVASANTSFKAQPGEEIIIVSKDKKKVSVSGALPLTFLQDLIKVLNK